MTAVTVAWMLALPLSTSMTIAEHAPGLQPLTQGLQGAGCAVSDGEGRLLLTLDYRSRPKHLLGVAAIRIAGVDYRLDWEAPAAKGPPDQTWRFYRADGAVEVSLQLGALIELPTDATPSTAQEGDIRAGVLQLRRAGQHDEPIAVRVHCGA